MCKLFFYLLFDYRKQFRTFGMNSDAMCDGSLQTRRRALRRRWHRSAKYQWPRWLRLQLTSWLYYILQCISMYDYIYTFLYIIYIIYIIYIYTYLYNIIELRLLCQNVHSFLLFFSWSWAQEKPTPVATWQPVARRNGGPCHAHRPQPRRPQFCAGHHGGSHEAEHAIEGDPGSPWQWVDNMLTFFMFLLKIWMQVHISITCHLYI